MSVVVQHCRFLYRIRGISALSLRMQHLFCIRFGVTLQFSWLMLFFLSSSILMLLLLLFFSLFIRLHHLLRDYCSPVLFISIPTNGMVHYYNLFSIPPALSLSYCCSFLACTCHFWGFHSLPFFVFS